MLKRMVEPQAKSRADKLFDAPAPTTQVVAPAPPRKVKEPRILEQPKAARK